MWSAEVRALQYDDSDTGTTESPCSSSSSERDECTEDDHVSAAAEDDDAVPAPVPALTATLSMALSFARA